MIEYAWPECPWCCAQPEGLSDLAATFYWQLAQCSTCHRPFELRMTAQANFEMRQVPEAVSP
jgi:hypothetical protein